MGRYRKTHIRWKFKFILLAVVFVFLFVYLEANVRSTIKVITEDKTRIIASQVMNDAFAEAASNEEIAYDDLVKINYGNGQKVGAIEVDSLKANQLRSEITNMMIEKIEALDVMDLAIPLGTLTGDDLWMGRGPKITFKMFPNGYFNSKITSEFDSAGINQTRHRIKLDVSVNMISAVPLYRTQIEVQSEFILAETIIVGEIPEYYTQVISEDQTVLDKANEYSSSRAKLFQ